ncbi:MAG: class II aldolase/adducin family protein [Proteobacteria bacterium]|nr:class II aldolase/adducin family protein [Pseudomonadota bacterium]MDA1325288.1 class II aldolase/adducin family protein [Pseudomonadota bacterium]
MAELSNSLRADLDELARACRVMEMEGQGDRVVGHMALRDPEGRGFWMKRAGVALGEIFDARDFVLLDFDGRKLAGDGKSHGEWPIHSEILRLRPEINATAHTHPFYASVYSASDEPLMTIVPRSTTQPVRPPRFEDGGDLICTRDVAVAMVAAMAGHNAVLLRNHGIVTCGANIEDPVLVAIALEKMCHEALTMNASGLKFSCPQEDALLKKLDSGTALDPSIIGGKTQWAYYCRKLARAEKSGDPRLATEPVPI